MTPAQTEIPEIRRALNRCHRFEDCVLTDLRWLSGGESIELSFNYIHGTPDEALSGIGSGPVGERDGLIDDPWRLGIQLGSVQELRIFNSLGHGVLRQPECLDWGWCEVSFVELANDSLFLGHYSSSPVPMHHLVVHWESDRRIDVVFSSFALRDRGPAAEEVPGKL